MLAPPPFHFSSPSPLSPTSQQAHQNPDTHTLVPTWELQLTALAGADLTAADYTGAEIQTATAESTDNE